MCLRKPKRSKSEPDFRENTAKEQPCSAHAALPGLMGKNNLGKIARNLSRSLPEQAQTVCWSHARKRNLFSFLSLLTISQTHDNNYKLYAMLYLKKKKKNNSFQKVVILTLGYKY